MRISSLQMYSKSVNELLDKQATLSTMQVHIASGKKIFTSSDDPVGATKAMSLKSELNSSEMYQKNCIYAKNYLERQEGIVNSTIHVIQRISELTVQVGNAALSDTDRYAIVEEINIRKKELFDLSNIKDANGDYYFSGFKSNVPAIKIDGAGKYLYQGDDGLRQLNLGGSSEVATNLNAKNVFFNIPNSKITANSTPGKTVINSMSSGLVNSIALPVLSNQDLMLNKIHIPASSGSAITMAQSIDSLQSDHGISASALPNQVNLGIFSSGMFSVNQLSVNQVPIIDPIGTENSLMSAMNAKADLTGVIATQPGGTGTAIFLNAADGRNIQIQTDGSSTAAFVNFNTSGGISLDKTQRAGIMLRSDKEINIGGANPDNIGLTAGSYLVSTNVGSATLQADIISDIEELSQTYSIIFGAAGTSFSIYHDANPAQAMIGFQDIPYKPGEKIQFQSFQLTLTGVPQTGDIFSLSSERPAYQDIFQTIDNIIYAVKNFGKDSARLNYEVGIGLSNLDSTQSNLSQVQSIVGASLNVADSQLDIQADFQLTIRSVLSHIEDLDYARAISDLTQSSFILEAAQKSFVHIQSLSIFNYLRA